MSRCLLPLVVFAIIAVALLSRADEPDLKTVSTDDLIARLGSAEFAEREEASKALRERGPSVLPALRKAAKDRDAEVRERSKELISTLEIVAAISPKRVTLNVVNQPLSKILKEIEKQTGYEVAVERVDHPKRYSIAIKDMLFWQALELICHQSGHEIITEKPKRTICLKASKGVSPCVFITDAFRFELTELVECRTAHFNRLNMDRKAGQRSKMEVTVSVMAEPNCNVLAYEMPHIDSAVDEEENSLIIPDLPTYDSVFPIYSSYDQGRAFALSGASRKSQTIKEIRGTIPFHVITERKPVVITDKFLESKGTKFQVGRDSLLITRAELNKEGSYDLKISVPPEEGERLHHHWQDRFHVEDAKGNRFEWLIAGYVNRGNEIYVYFTFQKDPALGLPTRAVFEEWTIVRHFVPFVFKDVPLP